jgi:hypothetical protein
VSKDAAGIEPRTVATSALAIRSSNHSARFLTFFRVIFALLDRPKSLVFAATADVPPYLEGDGDPEKVDDDPGEVDVADDHHVELAEQLQLLQAHRRLAVRRARLLHSVMQLFRIRIFSIPDPRSKNLSILTQKIVSKLSKI